MDYGAALGAWYVVSVVRFGNEDGQAMGQVMRTGATKYGDASLRGISHGECGNCGKYWVEGK